MNMIFWAIVAIFALIGQARLIWREASATRREAAKRDHAAKQTSSAMDTLNIRILHSEASIDDVRQTIVAEFNESQAAKPRKPGPKFESYPDKRKGFRIRLRSANGKILFHTEAFTRRRDVDRAIQTIIDTVANARVVHLDKPQATR